MSEIKLYLNEDIHLVLAESLRRRGINAIIVQEAKLTGFSDEEQLKFAIKQKRVVLTFNKIDYIKLHNEFINKKLNHFGIIVSEQLPIGELLKRILKLCNTLTAEDMKNRLEYLSGWK